MKAATSTSITMRLSSELIEALDRVVRAQASSRSQVIEQAVRAYLADDRPKPRGPRSYAGRGSGLSTRRTAEEVEAEIRWLRASD